MLRTVLLFAVTSALALLGCPPSGEKGENKAAPAPTTTACTKVGATCEFSPGKLGSCVERDGCATPPCFVCQSQH
jgi:hypothetical protein